MGRLPKNLLNAKMNPSSFKGSHERHREADCKYRSKVQFLYSKMKLLLRKKSAKDGLLDNALGFIQDLENDIYKTSGPDYMDSCKNEFLNFLEQEELIWKKEKDVDVWWKKVDDLLSKDQPMNLAQKEVVNVPKDNRKRPKSVKPRKGLKSSENLNKNGASCLGCVNEHTSALPFNEEPVDIHAVAERRKDVTSSSWNFPQASNLRSFVSNNNKGDLVYEETMLNNSNSNSNDIFSAALPLEDSCALVPVDNSSIGAIGYSQSSVMRL